MINIRRLYCVKTALGVPLSERYGTRETVLSDPNNTIVSFGLDCSENGMGDEAGIEERLRSALQQRYLMEVPRRDNPE